MLTNKTVLIDNDFEQTYINFFKDNFFTPGYWIVVVILALLTIILYNPSLGDSGLARAIRGIAFATIVLMIGLYVFVSYFS